MTVFQIIVMAPIFVILLVVIFKPVKTAFNLDTFPSCVLSVCVSALCVIGINHFLKSSIEVILWPYVALGITLLLLLMIIKIGLLADSVKSFFRPPCREKDKVITTFKQNSLKQIKPK